jgi:UDP-N-acetylmuramyl pentapeptide phosphotransferase/UDP-N-acetylglucosamine-1-phosphate transferase
MKTWIKGLVSAAIGAAANSVTVIVVAPETFNLQDGLPKLASIAAVSALVAVASYLKKSPLPN